MVSREQRKKHKWELLEQSPYLYCLNLDWPHDLFWPTEWGGSNTVPLLNLHLKEALLSLADAINQGWLACEKRDQVQLKVVWRASSQMTFQLVAFYDYINLRSQSPVQLTHRFVSQIKYLLMYATEVFRVNFYAASLWQQMTNARVKRRTSNQNRAIWTWYLPRWLREQIREYVGSTWARAYTFLVGLHKYLLNRLHLGSGRGMVCSSKYSTRTLWIPSSLRARARSLTSVFNLISQHVMKTQCVLIIRDRGLTEQMAICSKTTFIWFCRKLCYFCLVQWRKSCISIFPQSISLFRCQIVLVSSDCYFQFVYIWKESLLMQLTLAK